MLRWLRDFDHSDYAGARGGGRRSRRSAPEARSSRHRTPSGASAIGQACRPSRSSESGPTHTASATSRAPTLESIRARHRLQLRPARFARRHPGRTSTLTGGGAHSAFAAQLLADVLGRRVVVPALDERRRAGRRPARRRLDRPASATPERACTSPTRRHAAYAAARPPLRGHLRAPARLPGRDAAHEAPARSRADLTPARSRRSSGELGYEIVDRRGEQHTSGAHGRRRARAPSAGSSRRERCGERSSRRFPSSASSPACGVAP